MELRRESAEGSEKRSPKICGGDGFDPSWRRRRPRLRAARLSYLQEA